MKLLRRFSTIRKYPFIGLPFKYSQSEAENIFDTNTSFFEKNIKNLIPDPRKREVKKYFIPFYSADIRSVNTTYTARYGINKNKTITYYILVGNVMAPCECIETYTVWYTMSDVLTPTNYSIGTSETQIYAGFAFPNQHIDTLMRKQDVAHINNLTDQELLDNPVMYPHDMASSMAKKLINDSIETLERVRAEQFVKNKYGTNHVVIEHIDVNIDTNDFILKSYHLPAFVKSISDSDNKIVNYKFVDGYTGKYHGGDIVLSESKLFGLGTVVGLVGFPVLSGLSVSAMTLTIFSRMILSGILSGLSSSILGKIMHRYKRKSTENQILQSIEQNKTYTMSEEDLMRCQEAEKFNKDNIDYVHRFKYLNKK